MPAETTTADWLPEAGPIPGRSRQPVLVILASAQQPERIGECASIEALAECGSIGRRAGLSWERVRPGHREPTGPLDDPMVSRVQLEVDVSRREKIAIKNVGRLPLLLNGYPVSECTLQRGDILELGDRVMLLVTEREREMASCGLPPHPFGGPDTMGWVGESPAAWALRSQVVFVAERHAHVLVTGPSGSGKELVARGLHGLSARAGTAMVSRNAATIPESLADVELFGHAAGFPNPGMPARPGLVGEVHGSTLFLDEFGELPTALQARLLRVLDHGEYTRLGEARPRHSDLRLIAATNRDPAELKHDVLARLKLRVEVPSLHTRVEDIPLIVVHLLRGIVHAEPSLAPRIFPAGDPDAWPGLTMASIRRLVCHGYSTHVRELEAMLWRAIGTAAEGVLEVGDVPAPAVASPPPVVGADPGLLDPARVQAMLDRHGGLQEPVWRELGLSNRHVLARFVTKHGLSVRRRS